MKLPLEWLKDYMTLDIEPKDYCDKMTMSGSKVEGCEEIGGEISGVVVGRILEIDRHPNADKLVICHVDVGGETLQIVTGAPNVRQGALVPVARSGATLPGGVAIKKGKLRGELSEGMLCSHSELGLALDEIAGADENGILLFQADYPLGADVKEVLAIGGAVVEFEITSNRPDCLSVIGLARESAATLGRDFRIPEISLRESFGGDVNDFIRVRVEDGELCPRYCARAVKNVKIAPSPDWLKKRLKAAGVRAINNIVDITNYVMLEYGQPLHAFDTRFLDGGEIVVRRAAAGEIITTLDGQERKTDADTLLICDAKKAIAVAGVMGGANSDIKEDTVSVLFESANFNRASVRRTAKKLGLRTESSSRFEKGLDPELTIAALGRACQLVELLGAGEVVKGIVDVNNSRREKRVLPLRCDKIRAFIGCDDISDGFIVKTLKKLAFEVNEKDMTVIPPSFRADVEGEADLAEEIARLFGYDRIPTTLLSGSTTIGGLSARQKNERAIKQALISQGFYEIITYSFYGAKSLDLINAPESLRKSVTLLNPLGEDTGLMRTTAAPGMLEVISRNFNRKNKNARFFEIGTVYIPRGSENELPEEKKTLTLGGYGEMDFYTLKGALEEALDALGISRRLFKTARETALYHPGKSAELFIGEEKAGILGALHPDVLANYDLSGEVYIAEVSIEALLDVAGGEKKYKPLSKLPPVSRDIAMLIGDDVTAAQVETVIKKCGGALLEDLSLFDVYKGAQIPKGQKSMAYSATFRGVDKTLTEEEINAIVSAIVKALSEKLGAQLR